LGNIFCHMRKSNILVRHHTCLFHWNTARCSHAATVWELQYNMSKRLQYRTVSTVRTVGLSFSYNGRIFHLCTTTAGVINNHLTQKRLLHQSESCFFANTTLWYSREEHYHTVLYIKERHGVRKIHTTGITQFGFISCVSHNDSRLERDLF
jgi:hypothetical protein